MAFVSITRLRIRSVRFLPEFVFHTLSTNAQLKRAAGFVGGALLPDRKRAFWTMTVWHGQADMKRYITTGSHLRAMPKLLHWCDEASIVHWEQSEQKLPDWQDADQRMREDGRPSKVRHPSADHQGMTYQPPRTSRSAPINPAR